MPYANDDDCPLGLDDVSEDISASAERDEPFSTVRFVPHRAPNERIGAQKVRAIQNRRRRTRRGVWILTQQEFVQSSDVSDSFRKPFYRGQGESLPAARSRSQAAASS